MIRIVLADDHPIVRRGIRSMLERADDLVVVGEADNGAEALHLVAALTPDVLLLDMEMPGLKGLDVAVALRDRQDPVRVLALSAYDDEQYIFGLLDNGAAGYLTKDEVPTTIIEAVRGVARGEEGWISRRVANKLVRRKRRGPEHGADLSERELEVLRLIAHGHPNTYVAEQLFISEGTVKNHVSRIYDKLGVRTRAEAVAWAWHNNIVE